MVCRYRIFGAQCISMSKPPIILTVGGTMMCALILVAVMFPIYQLPNGKAVRRFVCLPPVISIPSSLNWLEKKDVDRLDRDPAQHAILHSIRSAPEHYSPPPIWFGYKDNPTKNNLSIATIVVAIGYFWILRHKGIV